MCIRYQISVNPQLMRPHHAKGWEYLQDLNDGDDVYPGSLAPIALLDAEGDIAFVRAQWGLIPPWAKDPKFGRKNAYNARSESLSEKPTFRSPFQKRRCIVPAQAFFERDEKRWVRFGAREGPFSIAGLFENPNSLCPTPSFTMVTTDSNELVTRYNDRMPVLLAFEDVPRWLDPAADAAELRTLLIPFPENWVIEQDGGSVVTRSRPAATLFDDAST